ncbi:MAG: DUF4238 domain-containing protein [Prolixibacteraceae bacterium]|nr:DUF4238 domain-containing protein [Prolixibacteraceae bacterium]
MANKKNQHFVPQFYLRRFTRTMKSPFIELFIYSSQSHVKNAPIKNQASEKHFYDNDNSIENMLEIIEGEAAKSLKKIDHTGKLSKSKIDHINILAFSFFQLARTKQHAKEVQTTINKIYQQIYKDDPRFKGFFDNYRIEIEKPATFSIGIISKILRQTVDLKIKLIVNKTNQRFITSDNPVLGYNQFLEKRKVQGSITGIALKGIQYFLPIDSNNCLVFYDSKTYKVGKWYSNIILVKNKKEIDLINLLQFLNCEDHIYFNDETEIDYIRNLYQKSKKYEKAGIPIVNEYPEISFNDGENASLIHSYKTDLKIGLEVSFIRECKRAKKYKMEKKLVHLRNEKLIESELNHFKN